jgi:hypothetical protein
VANFQPLIFTTVHGDMVLEHERMSAPNVIVPMMAVANAAPAFAVSGALAASGSAFGAFVQGRAGCSGFQVVRLIPGTRPNQNLERASALGGRPFYPILPGGGPAFWQNG